MIKRKVIVDCDPGVDDALALLALFNSPETEVLGVTTVAGNKGIDFTTKNAARIITYADLDIPVYPGADRSLEAIKNNQPPQEDAAGFVHGKSGLGATELPYQSSLIQDETAKDFILNQVRKYPGEIDLIALGPLTNLSLAIEEDKETMKQLKSIHSMGGGVYRGNRSPVAEFNYWFDPRSVEVVYQELGYDLPIHMVGLDVTHQGMVDANDLTFMRFVGGETGELVNDLLEGYLLSYWDQYNIIGGVIHDLMAIIGYLHPNIYSKVYHAHLECVTDSIPARGQCIVDLAGQFNKAPNAQIPMKVDVKKYKEYMMGLLFNEEVQEKYLAMMQNTTEPFDI